VAMGLSSSRGRKRDGWMPEGASARRHGIEDGGGTPPRTEDQYPCGLDQWKCHIATCTDRVEDGRCEDATVPRL
jgi:hypothetical protein